MNKISNFLLASLLILVICSPVLSQDNVQKGDTPNMFIGPQNQSQVFDRLSPPHNLLAIPVIPGNNSTSANARAPQGSRVWANSRYLITGTEMTTSGFGTGVVNSIGWRWNVPFPPAAAAPTPQNISTTGTLKVFLRDTVGTATTLTGTFIDTNGTGYTKIIDGTITIPAGSQQIDIDIPVGGPGTAPFSPTAGNGVVVIFVYHTTSTLATPVGAPLVTCTNVGSIFTYQSNTAPGTIGAASTFRPVTRFGNTPIAACDVGPTNVAAPFGVLPSCPPTLLAPKATIHNWGTADQTGILVTYNITGPVAYSSTRTIDLTAQESRVITFDSTFAPSIAGTYNVTVYTTLACDTILSNDTVKSTFDSKNPSFGGPLMTCPYFFANSTACASGAPSQPVFEWIDTTGSTALVLNNIQQNAAAFTGSLDDGHWSLEIPGPDQFRFCSVDYDSFFVSTNGFIAFTKAFNTTAQFNTSTPLAIPLATAPRPAAFAFWKDFNYADTDVPINRLSYKTIVTPGEGLVLLITYDRAPNFGATTPTDYASFQVILQLAPGPVTDGRIIYQYDDSRTGADFLAKYFGFTLIAHTVGVQTQTGLSAIQYRRVNAAGAANVVEHGPLFTSPVAVAFGPSAAVLPVELASFTSTVNRRDVTLNWTTTRENNNSGFDIERAILNGEWSKVGFVQGNGTSTSSINYSFVDRGLNSGKYNYRLKQIDFNGNFEYFNLNNEVGIGIPTKYDLAQNYPNPFNPTTKINYDIPFDGKVSLKIFDISGREVSTLVNEVQSAGYYTLNFNGANLSSGAYFYRISADGNGQNFVATKKMMLIK